MFPEFASIYKDDEGYTHLYVFPGLDEDGKQLYRNMDLNNKKDVAKKLLFFFLVYLLFKRNKIK